MTIDTKPARELIIQELKLDGFTSEEQQEIIDMLEENILIKVNTDIFNLLDQADRAMFIMLNETRNNAEIGEFLKDKVQDLPGLVRRAAQYVIRDFKQSMF